MKVRLLEDVFEKDRRGESAGLKTSRRRNRAWGEPQVVYGQLVQCAEPEFLDIQWTKGTVIEMSEASGAKYIESGKGEAVE